MESTDTRPRMMTTAASVRPGSTVRLPNGTVVRVLASRPRSGGSLIEFVIDSPASDAPLYVMPTMVVERIR